MVGPGTLVAPERIDDPRYVRAGPSRRRPRGRDRQPDVLPGRDPELALRRSEDTLKKAEIALGHARIEAGGIVLGMGLAAINLWLMHKYQVARLPAGFLPVATRTV
jgi:hypothetical protein